MVSASNHVALATIFAMYIECVTSRNSPPAVLFRASFRHHGKVKRLALANLLKWLCPTIEGLRFLAPRSELAPARSLPSKTLVHPAEEDLGIEGAYARELGPAMDWLLQRRTASSGTVPPSTWKSDPWSSATCHPSPASV